MADKIESMTTTNPTQFWNKVQNLGPRKDPSIPIQIRDTNGSVLHVENRVFERWSQDFENLYNCENNDEFDETHFEQTKLIKK